HDNIALLLISYGANVDAQGQDGSTALAIASHRRWEDLAQLLIHKGASLNAQGGKYGTALVAAVRLLLASGADLNLRDPKYGSPVEAASRRGLRGVVQLLRSHGAK
ncbi:ankyrin repeat-containing domain protein, partial [Mycena olivaceomarginata]